MQKLRSSGGSFNQAPPPKLNLKNSARGQSHVVSKEHHLKSPSKRERNIPQQNSIVSGLSTQKSEDKQKVGGTSEDLSVQLSRIDMDRSRAFGDQHPITNGGAPINTAAFMKHEAPVEAGNAHFHGKNIHAFLEEQTKSVEQLVYPDGKGSPTDLGSARKRGGRPSTVLSGYDNSPSGDQVQVPLSRLTHEPLFDDNDQNKNQLPQSLALLHESLSQLTGILGFHEKIAALSVGQVLSFSNKAEDQITSMMQGGSSPLLSADELVRSATDFEGRTENGKAPGKLDLSMFNLSKEEALMALPEEEGEGEDSDSDGSVMREEDVMVSSNQSRLVQAKRDSVGGKQSNNISFKNTSSMRTRLQDPGDNSNNQRQREDIYLKGYRKARKLFKFLVNQNEQYRHEQIVYALSTLRLLCLFLQTVSRLGPKLVHMNKRAATASNGTLSPSIIKFDRFVCKMDQRIKLTVFLLIQRMADEERMNQVAQEAFDMHKLSEKDQKNLLHAQNNNDGIDPAQREELMNKRMLKDANEKEDARKLFDQDSNEVNKVDQFLYNHFTVAQLVKLKLDFLAILHLKKAFINQNFDEHTRVELLRFEEQCETGALMHEQYLADAKRTADNLDLLGIYRSEKRDPFKIYMEMSTKNLIIGNRLSGPCLASDPHVARLLQSFFCQQVALKRETHLINLPQDQFKFSPITRRLFSTEKFAEICVARRERARMRRTLDEHKVTVDPDILSVEIEGLGDEVNLSQFDVRPSTDESFVKSALHQTTTNQDINATTTSKQKSKDLVPKVSTRNVAAAAQLVNTAQVDLVIDLPRNAVNDNGEIEERKQDRIYLLNQSVSSKLFVQNINKDMFGKMLPSTLVSLLQDSLINFCGTQVVPSLVKLKTTGNPTQVNSNDDSESEMDHPCCDPLSLDYLDADMPDILGLGEYKLLVHVSKGHDVHFDDTDIPDSRGPANISTGEKQQLINDLSGSGNACGTFDQDNVVANYNNQIILEEQSPALSNYQARVSQRERIGGLATQDLILLTDFVSLPDLVLALSQADDRFDTNSLSALNIYSPIHSETNSERRLKKSSTTIPPFGGATPRTKAVIYAQNQQGGDQTRDSILQLGGELQSKSPLINLDAIESFLLKKGKNEHGLDACGNKNLCEDINQQHTKLRLEMLQPKSRHRSTKVSPAESASGLNRSELVQTVTGNEVDRDLFVCIMLMGMFEVKSLGQAFLDRKGEQIKANQKNRRAHHRFLKIEVKEHLEELYVEHLTNKWRLNCAEEGCDQLPTKITASSNILSQTMYLLQYYMNSQITSEQIMETLLREDQFERDQAQLELLANSPEEINEQGGSQVDESDSMISQAKKVKGYVVDLYNQLMIHQCLIKMKFDQMVQGDKKVTQLLYRDVYMLLRLYTSYFKDLHENDDPYVFGSAGYNETLVPVIGPNLSSRGGVKYFFSSYYVGMNDPEQDITEAGADVDDEKLTAHNQDYLNNKFEDQEVLLSVYSNDRVAEGAAQAVTLDLQLQQLQQSQQRFLQKLIHSIEQNHVQNEKLDFFYKRLQSEQMKKLWDGPYELEREQQRNVEDKARGIKTGSYLGSSHASHKCGGVNPQADMRMSPMNSEMASPAAVPKDGGRSGTQMRSPPAPGGKQQSQAFTLQHRRTLSNAPNLKDPQQSPLGSTPMGRVGYGVGFTSDDDRNSKDTSLVGEHGNKNFGMLAQQAMEKGATAQIPLKKLTPNSENIVFIQYSDLVTQEPETRCIKSNRNPPPPLRFGNGLAQAVMDSQFKTAFWYESYCHQRSNDLMLNLFSCELDKVEELLYACDLQMLEQRQVLVSQLEVIENGMEDKEHSIREQLRQIAVLEMQKGQEEDEMLDCTLRAIEIVNIADIAHEKERLLITNNALVAKRNELDKLEDALNKEKAKKEQKAKVATKAQGNNKAD